MNVLKSDHSQINIPRHYEIYAYLFVFIYFNFESTDKILY